jgi:hypothetical protein
MFDQGVGVVAFVADQKAETLVCTRGPNFPGLRLESRLVDPGPHQCDDFCPSHVANDELFDHQGQTVIKRYRCATTRLPV